MFEDIYILRVCMVMSRLFFMSSIFSDVRLIELLGMCELCFDMTSWLGFRSDLTEIELGPRYYLLLRLSESASRRTFRAFFILSCSPVDLN